MASVPRTDPASSPTTSTRGIALTLGGETFPTKKAAAERVQAILGNATPGEELGGSDLAVMVDLFLMHPSAAVKLITCARIVVEKEQKFGGKCFCLAGRGESARADFSYRKCFTPATANAEFSAACRSEISPDILAFKQEAFSDHLTCPFTGELLTWETTDVDHASPQTFSVLVRDFIAENGIDVVAVKYDHSGVGVSFVDPVLRWDWGLYHGENASLRLVSVHANRVLLREAS